MGIQTLVIHQAINICCVGAQLYVQMLYITCRNCFCTLVNVNLFIRNCFIYTDCLGPITRFDSSRCVLPSMDPAPTVPRRSVPCPHAYS